MMAAGTWPAASMADVAAAAGVSRQTLYNEFGSREGLASAVAVETSLRFRAGTVAAASREVEPVAALGAAMTWALTEARVDPIVLAALTDDASGLLPYLTTRSAAILPPIAAELAQALDAPGAAWACEVALRLTVSHLLSATRSDSDFVTAVCDLVSPLLGAPP